MPQPLELSDKDLAKALVEIAKFTEDRKAVMEGTKYDEDKPRVDLLDAEWLEGTGRVLGFGARKYAVHNWRSGIAISRLLGGLLRHTFAIMRGEDIDPESGEPHVYHLSCCAMFLSWTMKHKPELDDRWKPEN